MKKYAVLDINNIAINAIIAESLEVAEKVTSSNCIFISTENIDFQIGKLYSGGVFIDPPVEETP
jgi:hypothetical protein